MNTITYTHPGSPQAVEVHRDGTASVPGLFMHDARGRMLWTALDDPPAAAPMTIDWPALVQLDGERPASDIVAGLTAALDQFEAGSKAAQKAKGQPPAEGLQRGEAGDS